MPDPDPPPLNNKIKVVIASIACVILLIICIPFTILYFNSDYDDGHNGSNDREPSVYLTVSSMGPAGKRQYKRMGVYRRNFGRMNNGKPVWERHDGTEKIYYSNGKIIS